MNIIVAIIFGLKRALECIKMHHFEGEHTKIFPRLHPSGEGDGGYPSPGPGAFVASIRVDPLQNTFLDTGLNCCKMARK